MERLELSKPGLKNLSLDRFAFIPVSVPTHFSFSEAADRSWAAKERQQKIVGHSHAGEENRTPKTLVLSERCLPVASLPRTVLITLTRHELVAESGVSPDDLLVMSQPSLVPAPPPHQSTR